MKELEPAYILAIWLSFMVSTMSFRLNFPFHLKFFSVLLGLTFLVEFTAVYVVRKFHLGTNLPLYNSFMLVEFIAYAFYFKQIYRSRKARQFARLLFVLLPVCWLDSTILKFGLLKWNSYFAIVGGCTSIALAIVYYAQLLHFGDQVRLLKKPEFIIASAMLIFYPCVLPILGMLNFLNNDISRAYTLLSIIRILNIIMYSLFIYAYLCQRTMKR